MTNGFTVIIKFNNVSGGGCLRSDRVVVDLVLMARSLFSEPAAVIYEFTFLRSLDRPVLCLEFGYFIGSWSWQLKFFLLQNVIDVRGLGA